MAVRLSLGPLWHTLPGEHCGEVLQEQGAEVKFGKLS